MSTDVAYIEAVRDNPELIELLQPKLTKYIPYQPTVKQAAFLLLPVREALFGGAAGGGKSYALLMAALQYVDVPGYSALLLRRTYTDLMLPDALYPMAEEWLTPTDAMRNGMQWKFPSGATLTFGYMKAENDKYRYQSSQYQFIGFDELTQFSETQYRYMFSRLRRRIGMNVPLRVRSASNPGGIGHDWVKRRFIDGPAVYLPSRLDDNPYMDRDEYIKSLAHLDPITRQQLLSGDWSARISGGKFRKEWFPIVPNAPVDAKRVRYWDLAGTPKPGRDQDYTVGLKMAESKEISGLFFIEDVVRTRASSVQIESLMTRTAQRDGVEVSIIVEQEPGSEGEHYVSHLRRNVLRGFSVRGDKPTGDKVLRANPLAAAAASGEVMVVAGMWNDDFLDELDAFPDVSHDDQVDAASGAHKALSGTKVHMRSAR